jgi:hypothetical protein
MTRPPKIADSAFPREDSRESSAIKVDNLPNPGVASFFSCALPKKGETVDSIAVIRVLIHVTPDFGNSARKRSDWQYRGLLPCFLKKDFSFFMNKGYGLSIFYHFLKEFVILYIIFNIY